MALNDWYSCDGVGHSDPEGVARPDLLAIHPSRRGLMVGASIALASWLTKRSALAQIAVNPNPQSDNVLVVLFLRGGADGLSIIVPHGEDAYYKNRPNLSVPKPKTANGAIDLDGFFGLNPLLQPLMPFYERGELLGLHAVGSHDQTRSHFQAMAAMERGLAAEGPGPASGWLARYLAATNAKTATPLRAVAFSDVMPDSLRGSPQAIALQKLDEFRLALRDSERKKAEQALAKLYGVGHDEIAVAGRETLDTIATLNKLDVKAYKPGGGAAYPATDLGDGLKQVALLVKANLGLEVACLDKGGWDTHVAQGSRTGGGQGLGLLGGLLDDVGKSLAAFATDLGPRMKNVTVLVMTEFGRRVSENSGLGTDHGLASTAFVLGGGVKGSRVVTKWPGLRDDQLDPVGDLRVGVDYRDLLAEVLTHHGGGLPADVFPNYEVSKLGLYG